MKKELLIPYADTICDITNYTYKLGAYSLTITNFGTFELAPNANNPLHSGGVFEVLFTFKPTKLDSEDFYLFSLVGHPFFLPYTFGIHDSFERFELAAKLYLTYVERYFQTGYSRLHFLNIYGNSYYQSLV